MLYNLRYVLTNERNFGFLSNAKLQNSETKKKFIESQAIFDSYFTSETSLVHSYWKHFFNSLIQIEYKYYFDILLKDLMKKNWCQGNTEMKSSYFLRFWKIFIFVNIIKCWI